MSSNRFTGFDLVGFSTFFIGGLLAVSISSYRAADVVHDPVFPFNRFYQPDLIQDPPVTEVSNLLGPIGAFVSDVTLRVWGATAYLIVGSLLILSVMMIVGRSVKAPCIRLAGWFVFLIFSATLLSVTVTGGWSGPMIGPGGYVGALSHGLMLPWLGPIGCGMVSVCAALFGLILVTGTLPIRIAALTTTTVIGSAANRKRGNQKKRRDSLSVLIRGKRTTPTEDEEEEEDEDDQYEADEYEADEYEADEYEDDEQEYEQDIDEDDDTYEEEEEDEEEVPTETPTVAATAARGLKGLLRRATPAGLRTDGNNPSTETQEQTPQANATEARFIRPEDRKAANEQRLEVMEQLDEASRREDPREYDLPPIDLLLQGDSFSYDDQEKEVRRKAKILEKTFSNFNLNVKVVEIETGPVIAQYEIELEPGLRLSKITGLADDLAIALRVPSVRIVAPIPGKNTVGIEVPNQQRQVVRLRDVIEEVNGRVKKMRIPLYLGKDVSGNPLMADLSTLPHLLIAGRTGTGKSVCLNAIISSILMTRRPDEVRMLMIDPKMVELSGYKTLPHLMHPVVTDMRKAEAILAWAVDKMEERYSLLAQAGVRHVSAYNQLGEEELRERLQLEDDQSQEVPTHLPYIVIVADEIADLMMTAGKEVEQHIIRLAQKSRAVGIHLILATQKPTVDVITGLIKSNLPARIAFQVASRTDSRVVLDEMGAEKLLGNGDMLFLWPGTSMLLRGQGTFLTDEEINSVVECVSTGEQDFVKELVQLKVEDQEDTGAGPQLKKRDDLYESAVDIVVREGRGSVSLLQRCLGIGYGRAARLIDFMAEDGIVGPYNGSQAREVAISIAEWEAIQAGEETPASAPPESREPDPSKLRRSNKIVRTADWSEEEAAAATSPTRHNSPLTATTAPEVEDESCKHNAYEEDEQEFDELEDESVVDKEEEGSAKHPIVTDEEGLDEEGLDEEGLDEEGLDEDEDDEYEDDEYEDEEDNAYEGEDYESPEVAENEEEEYEEEDEAYDEDEYEIDADEYEPEKA